MDKCQVSNCKQRATVGAHGVSDGKVYSQSFCEAHYNQMKMERFKPEKERKVKLAKPVFQSKQERV